MNPDDILRDVLTLLSKLGIEYALTGSYASNIYGRIRSTFDADILVLLAAGQLERFLSSLGKDFYVDAATLAEVQEAEGQFNAIHRPTGLKIDFYLPQNAHDREALRRRRIFSLWGTDVSVIAPEDLILAKLAWAKKGGSARQIEDAKGVYEGQRDKLNLAYLKSKSEEFQTKDLLDRIL